MHVQSLPLKSFLSLFLFVLDGVNAGPVLRVQDAKSDNANHIFNTIHSSMRQWGSSLNHNGMSFFMATVPEGTQLYHGTASKEVVKGLEWLAFEPEHALVFARPRRGPPGGRRPGHGDENEHEHEHEGKREKRMELRSHPRNEYEDECDMGHHKDPHDPWSRQGHAHTPPPPELDGPPRPEHRPGSPPSRPPPDHRPRPHHDARPPPPPPPPPPPHHGGPPDHHEGPPPPPFDHHEGPPPPFDHHEGPPPPPSDHYEGPPAPPSHHREGQRPLSDNLPPPDHSTGDKGYLHTYIPVRPLKLLYVDGLSAGKTSNGTLDTQDILLLNLTAPPDSPMGGEIARARGICDLVSSLWENKIDGILRMEAGFEIILCEFEGKVERKSIITYDVDGYERPGDDKGRGGPMGSWRYIKAVSERYHGIGGNRVTLDYERFVSVFAFDDEGEDGFGLWNNDVQSDTPHPRLTNASPSQLEKVRDAVTDMILASGGEEDEEEEGRNWQTVADMVVKRYSGAIQYLQTDESVRHSKEAFASYLSTLLRPFISPLARNATLETKRCVAQFIPPFPLPPRNSPSLAHTTLHTVTTHICSTLINAFDASASTLSRSLAATSSPPYHALDLIDDLVGYLQWTSWKECGTCAGEEVCFIPIWPMGSLENHKNPRCVLQDGVGTGYWGRWGPPPGGHRPGGERPGHDDPESQRPGPEGPKLRNHDGMSRPAHPHSAHAQREHGWEGKGKHGDRPKHGGRRKGGHCGPRRHGPPPNHVHGGWDRGFWGRLRMSAVQVVEWFGQGRETDRFEVKVNVVDTRQR